MAETFLTIAGMVYLLMGTGHLLLTLRDVWRPSAFTPLDDAVRLAMQGTSVRFNPRLKLWDAWLGFNLSHSLGAMMFGAALLFAARMHLDAFLASTALQAAAMIIPACYLAIGIRFWFWAPVTGVGIGLACILVAVFS